MIVPDSTLIIQLIVFLVTAFLLRKFLFVPMAGLFSERERRTVGRHKEAESLKSKADGLLSKYEGEIEKARYDALREKEKIIKEGTDEARAILEKSREEGQKVVDEVRARVAEEKITAHKRLTEEASGLARSMAARLLGRALAVGFCILLLSANVWAEESGHHEPGSFFSLNLLWTTVNFTVFLWILVHYLKRPLKDFLLERRSSIVSSMQEAEKKKKEEEDRVQAISEKLARLAEAVAGILESLKSEGESEKRKILEEARAMSTRINQEMREVSDAEVTKARRSLREEAVSIAAGLTEEILKEKFSEHDQSRLVEEYISRLKSTPI